MDIHDKFEDWFIEQELAGRSHADIASELSDFVFKPDGSPDRIRQSTIWRSSDRIKHGKGITGKTRRAIRALFVYEANQRVFRDLMDALDEWHEYEAEQALIEHERLVAAERYLRARQKKVRAHARTVIRRMQDLGIVEKGDTLVYGDGAALIREGAVDFHYHDAKAEIVGYAPPEAVLAGMTAAQLREGVTREQRMRPAAVPPGHRRPDMIGIRRADVIPEVQYFDGEWFWGRLYADIDAWYELRDDAPDWWKSVRELPRSPDEDDISWYGRVFELETKLLEFGLVFEESILGWGDDWVGEEDEKRALVQDLERRRASAEVAAARRATALKLAKRASIVVVVLGLAWFVVIPVLDWLQGVIIAVARAVRGAAVAAYDGMVRIGENATHAAEVILTSPLTAGVLLVIVTLVFFFYPSPVRGQPDPARPWVMGITTAIGLPCIIALAIWAFAQVQWP